MVCQSGFPCTSDSTCALLFQDFLNECVKVENSGLDFGAVESFSKKQKTAVVAAHKSASEPKAWSGKIPAGAAASSRIKVETFFDPTPPKVETFFDPYQDQLTQTPQDDSEPEQAPSDASETT